ncbi:MAG: IS66 family insertion sequence element accessory protein TnpB [Deltaproteobacteria bacterium]|nr:IS66 family insertion sequence element accessory protein TnpB [Deltaproteobacteria bacterium]
MFTFADVNVYLAVGVTDLRKAINGLSILVEAQMDLDPFSGNIFGFCNRKRNLVKLLYRDINGFCLWQKKLSKEKFKWPQSQEEEVLNIGTRELKWLLDGLEIDQLRAHKKLHYQYII